MKKLFLIPLMAMLCTVMAWAATVQVGDYQALEDAFDNAKDGDVIEMTQNITIPVSFYDTYHSMNITKSITLDGKNHTITGYGYRSGNKTTIAINQGGTDSVAVIIKDLVINNNGASGRPIETRGKINSVTLDNVKILATGGGNPQGLTIGGNQASKANISIIDSEITIQENGGYPVISFNPYILTARNSKFTGFCALYFKGIDSSAGSAGTVVNAENCDFNAPNSFTTPTNEFGVFVMEDHNITLNLHNCGVDATQTGTQLQSMLLLNSWGDRSHRSQDINLNISGDNSHINGRWVVNDWIRDITDASGNSVTSTTYAKRIYYEDGSYKLYQTGYPYEGKDESKAFAYTCDINVTITGGTYSINPSTYQFTDHITSTSYDEEEGFDYEVSKRGLIIPAEYEVNEITMEGVATPLYRVVKKAATYEDPENPGQQILYDLNDLVAGEGEDYGDNPVSSFDLSTGTDMTLNNETTTAGYVSVSDDPVNGGTTVTVGQTSTGEDQTLVINNGLDVQGESQVVVETGANLIIGEGGITTESAENIVIEANDTSAASLLLNPAITVNQNPNLTVKMETNVGKFVSTGVPADIIWVWHYFAFPMKAGASWNCTDGSAVVPTYFQGWNYSTNDWESIVPATMKPFYGYILTYDKPYTGVPGGEDSHGTKVTYTFTGNLVGNEDLHLEFSAMGWNFFGNSYTAYISTKTFLDNIINDPNVGATIYMWDSKNQRYQGFTRDQINNGLTGTFAWANEVAPMQTFILQKRAAGDPKVEVNYADAIWNNDRYRRARGESNLAPARVMDTNSARAYITIAAANGQKDYVCLMEDAKYSDAYDNGGDGAKYKNAGRVNMFVTMDNEDYGTFATDNLAGKAISFQTNDQINYTLSISNVLGSQYAIRDIMTNSVISMAEGATYDFVAQPNTTIEGRFVIVPMQNMPTDVETVENTTAVKGIYTIMGQYVGEDFETLPAGVYVVDGVKVVK